MNTEESMALVLAAEEFLEAHRDELVQRYGNKVLVIRDAKVHGAYATFDEAVRAGIHEVRCGTVPGQGRHRGAAVRCAARPSGSVGARVSGRTVQFESRESLGDLG